MIEIVARPGARAVVAGQSTTRIHPALLGFATQQWTVALEGDASLVVLPGPTMPYRGSRYYQRGRADLSADARLIWGDVWLPGRYNRGALSERFVFERIVQDFEVRRAGRLVYRDRFRWDGPWTPDEAGWYFGGELATASLFVSGPTDESLPELAPAPGRSALRLASGDLLLRWCGSPAAVTAQMCRTALRIAATWEGGPDAPPWLLSSGNLAPNHWFSGLDDGRPEGTGP